ncbi:MAG: hypothetical protein J6Y00_04660 [Paludibacteraceae bacterium]|nr:hypothetical protein [Paludibacteraceae bacterium]
MLTAGKGTAFLSVAQVNGDFSVPSRFFLITPASRPHPVRIPSHLSLRPAAGSYPLHTSSW